MKPGKTIKPVIVRVKGVKEILFRASSAEAVAQHANDSGLTLVTPRLVSLHARYGILKVVWEKGLPFRVSDEAVNNYFTWLEKQWHGANLVRTAITEGGLFDFAKRNGIQMSKDIKEAITGDLRRGAVPSAGTIKIGGRANALFKADAALEYLRQFKESLPKRQAASRSLFQSSWELYKVEAKLAKNPHIVKYSEYRTAISDAENILKNTDRDLDQFRWDKLNGDVLKLKRIAQKAEGEIARLDAKEARRKLALERQQSRQEKAAEKKVFGRERAAGKLLEAKARKLKAYLDKKDLIAFDGILALVQAKIQISRGAVYKEYKRGKIKGMRRRKIMGELLLSAPKGAVRDYLRQLGGKRGTHVLEQDAWEGPKEDIGVAKRISKKPEAEPQEIKPKSAELAEYLRNNPEIISAERLLNMAQVSRGTLDKHVNWGAVSGLYEVKIGNRVYRVIPKKSAGRYVEYVNRLRGSEH